MLHELPLHLVHDESLMLRDSFKVSILELVRRKENISNKQALHEFMNGLWILRRPYRGWWFLCKDMDCPYWVIRSRPKSGTIAFRRVCSVCSLVRRLGEGNGSARIQWRRKSRSRWVTVIARWIVMVMRSLSMSTVLKFVVIMQWIECRWIISIEKASKRWWIRWPRRQGRQGR